MLWSLSEDGLVAPHPTMTALYYRRWSPDREQASSIHSFNDHYFIGQRIRCSLSCKHRPSSSFPLLPFCVLHDKLLWVKKEKCVTNIDTNLHLARLVTACLAICFKKKNYSYMNEATVSIFKSKNLSTLHNSYLHYWWNFGLKRCHIRWNIGLKTFLIDFVRFPKTVRMVVDFKTGCLSLSLWFWLSLSLL